MKKTILICSVIVLIGFGFILFNGKKQSILPIITEQGNNFAVVKLQNGKEIRHDFTILEPLIEKETGDEITEDNKYFIHKLAIAPDGRLIIFIATSGLSGTGGPAGVAFTMGPEIGNAPVLIGSFGGYFDSEFLFSPDGKYLAYSYHWNTGAECSNKNTKVFNLFDKNNFMLEPINIDTTAESYVATFIDKWTDDGKIEFWSSQRSCTDLSKPHDTLWSYDPVSGVYNKN